MRIEWILIGLNIMNVRAFLNRRFTISVVDRASYIGYSLRPLHINYMLNRFSTKSPSDSVGEDIKNEETIALSARNTTRFLFGTSPKLFREMNMSEVLSHGLSSIGFDTATLIQSAAFDTILSRKDAVIAAETGSGKTLSYLLPIIQQHIDDASSGVIAPPFYPTSIIMLPNKELGEQGTTVFLLCDETTQL